MDTIYSCFGEAITMYVEGDFDIGNNWIWSPTYGLSSEFGDTILASPSEITTYSVQLGEEDCLPIEPQKIVFKPIGIATSISDDQTIRPGENVTLEAIGGDSYTWFPTTGLSDPMSGITDAAPTETTVYNVIIGSDSFFCDEDTLTVTVFVEDDLGIPIENKYENISIYPNPFRDFTTINFGQELKEAHTIIIYDMLGKEVYKQEKITGSEYKIKSQQLSSGTYLLSLLNLNKDLVFETKLLVK